MPASCRNRFVLLWDTGRHDILSANGIVHAGIGENTRGYEFARTDPDFHLAIFTRSGKGKCRDDSGAWQTVKAGDVALFPAGRPHHYLVDGNNWDHFWFHLKADESWPFTRAGILIVRKSRHIGQLESLLTCYYNEMIRGAGSSKDVLLHIGEAILHYLRLELRDKMTAKTAENLARLEDLKQEIRNDPARKWSLARIAEALCFSRMHAIRFFRMHTGKTPIEYAAQCRMQAAGQRLRYSEEKIHSIGKMAGYADQFAFSVAFKRFYGISPREYRKRNP